MEKNKIILIVLVLLLVPGFYVLVDSMRDEKSSVEIHQTQPTQSSSSTDNHLKSISEIKFSGVGINPTVRDKEDFSSFNFEFNTDQPSSETLKKISIINIYNLTGSKIASVNGEDISYSPGGEEYEPTIMTNKLNLVSLKGAAPQELIYELSDDSGHVYFRDKINFGGYSINLQKVQSPARIAVDTLLVPKSCVLYSKADIKIADMQPVQVSNPSVALVNIPKEVSEVYAKCTLSDNSLVQSSIINIR